MSKSKQIFAALGVVASLGVAAMPLTSYAADAAQVTGEAVVLVEVTPAISMTIEGNNDTSAHKIASETYGKVQVNDNNVAEGGATKANDFTGEMEWAGGVVTSEATAKVSSSYVALTQNDRKADADFKSTITVYTNSTKGYNLVVNDKDDNTALTAEGTTETIPAGVIADEGGVSAWSIKVGSEGTWQAMVKKPAAEGDQAIAVKTSDTKTVDGEVSEVFYGVTTSTDQATGIYHDAIVYTATTK